MKIVSGIKYIHVYSVQIFDLIMPFLGQALMSPAKNYEIFAELSAKILA
jgi:hypothetical protein